MIKRYIWNEWLKVFGIILVLIVSLVIVQGIYTKLNSYLERGASALEVVQLFLLTVPGFLPAVIPLILLLSVLFSVGALHRKNEIVAMKAAGINLFTVSQPLMLGALLCALSILGLNASVIPWSVEQTAKIQKKLYEQSANEAVVDSEQSERRLGNLGFLNTQHGRLWLMSEYYPLQRSGENVAVYEMGPNGQEVYRIQARVARYIEAEGYWVFEQGRELFYDGKTEEPFRNLKFERLEKPAFQDDPDIMEALREKPQSLSLEKLSQILELYEGDDLEEIVPYRVRYYRMLASPISCFLVVGFAVPFAASGVRTNPMIGISKAFGMFMVYFIVSNFAIVIGEREWTSPLVAALIPLGFIGLLASWVFYRAR